MFDGNWKRAFEKGRYIRRDIEDELMRYLDVPEILAVVGPRQAGKTSLFYNIHSQLENSVFVSFEDRDILNIFEEDEKGFGELYLEDTDYLFIDEFQYAEKGGKKLKYLYDRYPGKKVLITGSSTVDMTVKGLKYLVGRVFKFRLFPFSFSEFLRAKDEKLYRIYVKRTEELERWVKGEGELTISDTLLERMEDLRREYIVYGGYPRVVLSKTPEEKRKVLDSIVDTYLIREIRDVMGISQDRRLLDLMKILALRMGEQINYNSVCEKGDITYNELKEWLSVLEHTFVLEQVRPFYTNKQKELIKTPKIYFYDNGFRNSMLGMYQDPEVRPDRGELNENFFFTQSRQTLKYWRTKSKAEVDFIWDREGKIAFEVKTAPKVTRSFRSFQKKYDPVYSFVMNEKMIGKEGDIFFVPLIFSEKIMDIFY